MPDIAIELPCRSSIESIEKGERSLALDHRYRPTPRICPIEVYPFGGEWVRLPCQLPPKLGNGKSYSDELVEMFLEIAAVSSVKREQLPAEFRPYKATGHHSGKGGHEFMLKSLKNKHSYLRISAELASQVYGGKRPVEWKKTCHLWLHAKAAGVRDMSELKVFLSKDGEEWTGPVWEGEGKGGQEVKLKYWQYVKASRASFEAKAQKPWEDGVWSIQMTP